jgi:hypothetical protein
LFTQAKSPAPISNTTGVTHTSQASLQPRRPTSTLDQHGIIRQKLLRRNIKLVEYPFHLVATHRELCRRRLLETPMFQYLATSRIKPLAVAGSAVDAHTARRRQRGI